MYIFIQVICWSYVLYCCHFCSAMALTGLLEGWCPRLSMYCSRDCLLCVHRHWIGEFRDSGNPYRHVGDLETIQEHGEGESISFEREPDFV